MKNSITGIIICTFILLSCSNNKNPYENTLGIEPVVLAQMDTANYTQVLWEDSVKNIGTIKTTDTVRMQFKFKNIGDKPLFIITVSPACGCTVASFPKEPTQAGKEGVINAMYAWNGQLGTLRKTISVRTNTNNGRSHTLVFFGEIIKDSLLKN